MQRDEALAAAAGVDALERLGHARGRAQVDAGLEDVRRVEAHAEARVAAGGVDDLAELEEVDAHGAAGAGRVLEQEAHRRALAVGERAPQAGLHALEAGREAGALVRADVGDDGVGAQLVGRRQGAAQRRHRLLVEVLVLAGQVDQVDGVDERRSGWATRRGPRGTAPRPCPCRRSAPRCAGCRRRTAPPRRRSPRRSRWRATRRPTTSRARRSTSCHPPSQTRSRGAWCHHDLVKTSRSSPSSPS